MTIGPLPAGMRPRAWLSPSFRGEGKLGDEPVMKDGMTNGHAIRWAEGGRWLSSMSAHPSGRPIGARGPELLDRLGDEQGTAFFADFDGR
jgi:hypothetical protein